MKPRTSDTSRASSEPERPISSTDRRAVAPPGISQTDIFRGFVPFIAMQLAAPTLLLIAPPLVSAFL
jgi:TRAP-type mannitol/chloroaromatic compound transport system permease large subunit